jgi:FdhD protein
MFYQAIDSLLTATIKSPLTITPEQVCLVMSQLNQRSGLYKETRGVHNVALATPDSILLFRSDIGRHNAVDMICGECFLENIPLEDKLLLTTGRITSEILLKAARMKTPFIISRNVATYHSITLGQAMGITLIGDMRGDKFTVYTHPERVMP